MRGFACIGLDHPKDVRNAGGVWRAAHCYGADLIVVAGARYKKSPLDTTKAHRHIPLLQTDSLFDVIPYNCVPVAVDLVDGATSLVEYQHPERAFYIFGGEDATLGARVLDKCRDRVYVPTQYCMNLAATVNVVLYDRLSKQEPVAQRIEHLTSNQNVAGSNPAGLAKQYVEE